MKKVNLYIFLTLCSFAIFLLTTPSKVKAEVVDKQTQHQLQDYMKDHPLNGVKLVNGNNGKPVAIENHEHTNKDQ
ncbi:serine hydrolase, partial [Limosilactobacillus reuteri]